MRGLMEPRMALILISRTIATRDKAERNGASQPRSKPGRELLKIAAGVGRQGRHRKGEED